MNVAYTSLELFCPNYACQVSKTCLAIIVNHLELFSTIFGAKFVFKLLTKYAFEIIIENGKKILPIQLLLPNSKAMQNFQLVPKSKVVENKFLSNFYFWAKV